MSESEDEEYGKTTPCNKGCPTCDEGCDLRKGHSEQHHCDSGHWWG